MENTDSKTKQWGIKETPLGNYIAWVLHEASCLQSLQDTECSDDKRKGQIIARQGCIFENVCTHTYLGLQYP